MQKFKCKKLIQVNYLIIILPIINYYDVAFKLFKGPFFLKVNKNNNFDPIINLGFNYWIN